MIGSSGTVPTSRKTIGTRNRRGQPPTSRCGTVAGAGGQFADQHGFEPGSPLFWKIQVAPARGVDRGRPRPRSVRVGWGITMSDAGRHAGERPFLDRYFGLSENGTDVRTEFVAGLTTFLTMVYIVFVNPQILANAGMDKGAVFVATCLAAALSTLIMALYANYPIALAPGMGLNVLRIHAGSDLQVHLAGARIRLSVRCARADHYRHQAA